MAEIFYLRLKWASLANKGDIVNFVKKSDFDNKLKDHKSSKNELNELSKTVKAISTKGLTKDLIDKFSILNVAKYFFWGIFQNYLVFIKFIKYFTDITPMESWKSNGMSEESIQYRNKSNSNSALTFADHNLFPDMNFNGHCLIKTISIPKKVINLYISNTLGLQLKNLNTDFTLGNCLFGTVKLTKNAYLDKYKYTGYNIGFEYCSEFLFTDGSYGSDFWSWYELICAF